MVFDAHENSYKTKMRIARAASCMIAYDNVFLYEFGTTSILRWDANVTKMVNEGVNSTDIARDKYKQKIKYVTKIETAHPGLQAR